MAKDDWQRAGQRPTVADSAKAHEMDLGGDKGPKTLSMDGQGLPASPQANRSALAMDGNGIGSGVDAGDMGRLIGKRAPRPSLMADQSSADMTQAVIMVGAAMYSEQGKALYRQGREDLLNTLWGQPLDREVGAPGEPTPHQIDRGANPNIYGKGKEINMELEP